MEISGATRDAAAEALATSAARRRPRFLVFHIVVDSRLALVVEGAVSSAGIMFSWATDAPGFPATVSRLPMVCVSFFFLLFRVGSSRARRASALGVGGRIENEGTWVVDEREGGWGGTKEGGKRRRKEEARGAGVRIKMKFFLLHVWSISVVKLGSLAGFLPHKPITLKTSGHGGKLALSRWSMGVVVCMRPHQEEQLWEFHTHGQKKRAPPRSEMDQ